MIQFSEDEINCLYIKHLFIVAKGSEKNNADLPDNFLDGEIFSIQNAEAFA